MRKIKKFIFRVISRIIAEILPAIVMKHKSNFHLWESKGYHVTPVHYYQNIPDTRRFAPDFLEKKSSLTGIKMNEDEQVSLLADFCARYKNEYSDFGFTIENSINDFFILVMVLLKQSMLKFCIVW